MSNAWRGVLRNSTEQNRCARYVKNRVSFTGGLAMSGNEKNKSATHMADKKWFIVMAIVLVCFAFSPPQAVAVTGWGKPYALAVTERQKLLASDWQL